MGYRITGLGGSGGGGYNECLQEIENANFAADKQHIEGYASCAADVYCGTLGVPPGVCSTVAGPIVGAVYDFFDDMFGGGGIDCSKGSQIVQPNGAPYPCDSSPCATAWYIGQYGTGGIARQQNDCATWKKKYGPTMLAQGLCGAIWESFEQAFDRAAGYVLDQVPGSYAGWACDPGYSPPSSGPVWDGGSPDPKTGRPHCVPKLSSKGQSLYADLRRRVVTSVGAPAKSDWNEPLYNAKYQINPNACTGTNGAPDQLQHMMSNMNLIVNAMLKENGIATKGSMPVINITNLRKLDAPSTPMGPLGYALLALGAAAAGYGIWRATR